MFQFKKAGKDITMLPARLILFHIFGNPTKTLLHEKLI